MDEPTFRSFEEIMQNIFVVRGRRVMLDAHLALLYGVPVKRLNEQVRRNMRRFPGDFIFNLTANEFEILRAQIRGKADRGRGRHRKYLPLAFTEQGIAMLSSVLKSERAGCSPVMPS